jgi:hypothetical protein
LADHSGNLATTYVFYNFNDAAAVTSLTYQASAGLVTSAFFITNVHDAAALPASNAQQAATPLGDGASIKFGTSEPEEGLSLTTSETSTSHTFLLWFYQTGWRDPQPGNAVLWHTNDLAETHYTAVVITNSQRILVHDYAGSTVWKCTSDAVIPLNQWVHVALVLDASDGGIGLYIDGTAAAVTYSHGSSTSYPGRDFGRYYLADYPAVGVSRSFVGYMDEFSYFGRSLTASEVADLHACGTDSTQCKCYL